MFGNNFQEAAQASLVSMLSVCPLVATVCELPALLCVGQVVPDLFNKLLAGIEDGPPARARRNAARLGDFLLGRRFR